MSACRAFRDLIICRDAAGDAYASTAKPSILADAVEAHGAGLGAETGAGPSRARRSPFKPSKGAPRGGSGKLPSVRSVSAVLAVIPRSTGPRITG